jgi:hypothetical protein
MLTEVWTTNSILGSASRSMTLRIALEEVTALIDSARDAGPQEWTWMIEEIQETFDASNHSIADIIPVEEALLIAADFLRHPVVQAHIGPGIIDGLVYSLTFQTGSMDSDRVASRLLREDPLVVVDVLSQLTTVGAAAMACGYETSVPSDILSAIEAIRSHTTSPILLHACTVASRRLAQEQDSPSLSMFRMQGSAGNAEVSRLPGSMSSPEVNEDAILNRQARFYFQQPFGKADFLPQWHLLRIASDHVGLFDQALNMRAIAPCRPSELPHPRPLDLRTVDKLVDALYLQEEDYREDCLHEAIHATARYVYKPLSREGQQETRAQFFSRLAPTLSAREWQDYFAADSQVQHATLGGVGLAVSRELRTGLSTLAQQERDVRLHVPLRWITDVASDRDLVPFNLQHEKQFPLLLYALQQRSLIKEVATDLGIAIESLPLRLYYATEPTRYERLKRAVAEMPDAAGALLTSFFACAADPNLGDAILQIAERATPDCAKKVFAKYVEILAAADRVRTDLIAEYGESAEQVSVDRVRRNQLLGANRLLVKYAEYLSNDSIRFNEADRLLAGLDEVLASAVLFAAFFDSLRSELPRGAALSLENLPNVSLERISATQINEQTRNELQHILDWNWEIDAGEAPEMIAIAKKGFDASFLNPDSEYFIVKHQGAILAARRVTKLSDGEVLFGGFNVRPEAHDSGIGSALAKMMLSMFGANHAVLVDISVRNSQLGHLQERYGFKRIQEYKNSSSETFCYRLRRDPDGG